MGIYELPPFLEGQVRPEQYQRWLYRKASAHVTRDRRKKIKADYADYRDRIHQAVMRSQGKDTYTGEPLNWPVLGQYKNIKEPEMPTLDHENGNFNICSWRTNDAKNDLNLASFIKLCQDVIKHNSTEH